MDDCRMGGKVSSFSVMRSLNLVPIEKIIPPALLMRYAPKLFLNPLYINPAAFSDTPR